MKVLLVFGIRPQIIKASLLSRALSAQNVTSVLVYTGQHYTPALSWDLFRELDLRLPDYDLSVGSGNYRFQISTGVRRLNEIVRREMPDQIVVIGDGNPALIGGLCAMAHGIPLIHVEAGLRNYDSIKSSEELNRVFVDRVADTLFCPTEESVRNLEKEPIHGRVLLTGDLLFDAWLQFSGFVSKARPSVLPDVLEPGAFCLFTLHRSPVAYEASHLTQVVNMLTGDWPIETFWPIHPGVLAELEKLGLTQHLQNAHNIHLIGAVTYLEMRWLEENSAIVVTDSVGIQVESYFARKFSIVLRENMEHRCLAQLGWSTLIVPDREGLTHCSKTLMSLLSRPLPNYKEFLFGNGSSAPAMAMCIASGTSGAQSERGTHSFSCLHDSSGRIAGY